MKALIFQDKVVQLEENEFGVSKSLKWMNAPEGCNTGWLLKNGNLVAPEYKPAIDQLRLIRNSKLAHVDWWAMSDLTMTEDQTAYRKALRDLPATASPELDSDGQLTGVTWPTKPDGWKE